MFESLATWMFAPGSWNDAVVYLGVLTVVGLAALVAFGE